MNKNSYEIYGSRGYRKNISLYTDRNSENKLRENIKLIHSNINFIKKSDPDKYEKDSFDKLCQETITTITETNDLLTTIQIENKNDILNFLNKSSQVCKNTLWYRQMKDYSTKIKNIDNTKQEIINSHSEVSHNVQVINSDIESRIQEKNKQLYDNIENKIDEKNKQELENLQNISEEIKRLSSVVNKQNDLYHNLEDKINCCMKSLACSMELLSYNIKKSTSIHDDLKKNNVITAKISMDNESINQRLLEFKDNSDCESNDSEEINNLKQMLLESNGKQNNEDSLPKNSLVHYLLHTILKNSKDILSQIIPQMNMWQRQKVFTSVMKLVEDRIDGCSDKLKQVINKQTGILSESYDNNEDMINTLKKVFNTETLKITKDDIRSAAWEQESSSDEDSDSDSDSDESHFNIEKNLKKNKTEILDDIMKELNKKQSVKIKKKT